MSVSPSDSTGGDEGTAPISPAPLWPLWAFPLGFSAMGTVEMIHQARRIGWDLASFSLGLFAGALPGVMPGVLVCLCLVLLRRRVGWKMPAVSTGTRARLAVVGAATLVLLCCSWVFADLALGVLRARPLHFEAAEGSAARGALFAGVVPAVIVVYLAMRAVESLFERRAEASPKWKSGLGWLGRGALTVTLAIGSFQVLSDQLVLYYSDLGPVVLALAWAAVAALWIPRDGIGGRRAKAVTVGFVAVCVLGGLAGLHRAGTRGLLFHDPRAFPVAFTVSLGVFDMDGDEDFPTWMGGTDCDDLDERVSGWRVEIPENGLDDNCYGGDRSAREVIKGGPGAESPRPPIFLITIDTVGSDHLDLYGYPRATMPALTSLAQSSRWFRRAYAPSNQTYFSTVSTLSGQSPERMLIPDEEGEPRRLRFTFWLPHYLASLGYHTTAIAPPLMDLQKMTAAELRFDEIDPVRRDYSQLGRGTNSRAVIDSVLARVQADSGEQPSFQWIHLMDPHAVHEAPMVFPEAGPLDRWDSELAYVDAELARLFQGLQKRYGHDVIIIVTADHGEQFGERGFFGHAYSLFDAVTRVPLVIFGPGVEPGEVEEPVSSVGITATILDMLGERPDSRLSTGSLLTPPDAPVLVHAPFYASAERRMEVALVQGKYKLIRNRLRASSLLFDLEADPQEQQNLAASHPEERERMETLLREALEAEP